MKLNYKNNRKLFATAVLVLTFIFSFNSSRAYSIGNSAGSFFDRNPLQLGPININRFIPKGDPSSLTFNDLVNTGSFSSSDISSSLKAVLALFIRLIITTLNVALGVFRVLLDVITGQLD